jgi:hypothetical protein
MARGRLILRTLGSSRKYADVRVRAAKLGEFAQSLYPLLVANSDDYGRLSGDAFTVKFAVFPTSPRLEQEFDTTLNAMQDAGLIVRYVAPDGRQVLQIVEFGKGQPNLHKRTPSSFPEFSGEIPEIREKPSQLNGTELKRTEPNLTALRAGLDGFPEFWSAYPKKRSKPDAEKAWRKLAPSPELSQRILRAIAAQRVTADWVKEDGKFVPFPATWLNGRRWEDEAYEPPEPVAVAPPIDWYEQCQQLHEGKCGGRLRHSNRMAEDAIRSREQAVS